MKADLIVFDESSEVSESTFKYLENKIKDMLRRWEKRCCDECGEKLKKDEFITCPECKKFLIEWHNSFI